MNSPRNIPGNNDLGLDAPAGAALEGMDATLRLLANLPVPAGLEDRVFAGMLAAPPKARVLEWPRPLYAREWVRGIAAAAIVLAVGGGGWGIYAHVQQNAPAQATTAPARIAAPGGFSSAEVIRRPQTLNGPVVKKAEPVKEVKSPAAPSAAPAKPGQPAAAHRRHTVPLPPAQARSRVAR